MTSRNDSDGSFHNRNILLLFCGGTITMDVDEDGALVVLDKEIATRQLLALEPRLEEIANVTLEFIDNIDSTNINPSHWNQLTDTIAENYDTYDGFVITHGTDTMAYTSSALSYTLGDLGKPVIITGAQIPGHHIESDARRNFVNAVKIAAMNNLSGVILVFDEDIILGSRATKVSESKLDAFESVNCDLLGEIRLQIRLSEEGKKRPRHNRELYPKKGFESNIAVFRLFPGFPSDQISKALEGGVRGVVLHAYGPGNISEPYLDAIKDARRKGIPVVVSTQCVEGATMMHLYEVGKRALEEGVIQSYDMSMESVITKFMWALNRAKDYEHVRTIMEENYTGEISLEARRF